MPPRDWQAVVEGMSNVQRLVHLAMRQTTEDGERIRVELLNIRKRAYEDELTIQAGRVGCPGRRGRLTNGQSLTMLNEMGKTDALSIVNTYNYDLAGAIVTIGSDTPTANRNVYARRLGEWESKRSDWKNPQIAQYAENSARSLAQQDFYRLNNGMGMAEIQPKTAVCPVCQGWIARGQVPLRVAENNPPPYHPSCPHVWSCRPERVAPDECRLLWMGE